MRNGAKDTCNTYLMSRFALIKTSLPIFLMLEYKYYARNR